VFNVLVTADETAWETDQLMRMEIARFKEYSKGIESASVSLEEPDTLKFLEDTPVLLMYERGTKGINADVVRYGRVHDIRIEGKRLVFRFAEEGSFTRDVVNEFESRLGMDKWEQTRTHWALKDGGIPEGMLSRMAPKTKAAVKRKASSIAPFISYAREDAVTAGRLYNDVKLAGGDPWLDREKLLGGQNWEAAIRGAIRNSTHFLALISTNSVNKRGFVQKELAHALEILDEFPPNEIFVIPIRLDSSSPKHERLQQLHWIDLFPSYDDGFRQVINSLGMTSAKNDSGDSRPPTPKAAPSGGVT
jgi:hypothetical protein